jgi:DNA-directed RNA polymerase subunit RPC12/RpoP
MPITFDCSACRQSLEVENESAGQEVECPFCDSVVLAPKGTRAKVVATKPPDEAPARPTKKKKRTKSNGDDSRWGPRDTIYDDDAYSRPMSQRWSNPGVVGGIVGMILAVIWFVCGIVFLDRIYIYPPFMLIFSLLAFLQGLGILGNSKDY